MKYPCDPNYYIHLLDPHFKPFANKCWTEDFILLTSIARGIIATTYFNPRTHDTEAHYHKVVYLVCLHYFYDSIADRNVSSDPTWLIYVCCIWCHLKDLAVYT